MVFNMIIKNRRSLAYTGIITLALLVSIIPYSTAHADTPQSPYGMSAQNASIPQAHISGTEKTVKAQLDAITARDANLAFSYMTDQSHEDYKNAKDFLSDMRFKFGAIYNHVDVEFLHSYENGRISVQKVKLKDRYSGESVTAVYKLLLQSSGEWLIDSFALIESEQAQPI